MYYVNTTQADTNNWQNTSQVQNWQDQQNNNWAGDVAQGQYPGWQVINTQNDGGWYKVHLRDSHGDYKTVFMDHDFHIQQMQDRYC